MARHRDPLLSLAESYQELRSDYDAARQTRFKRKRYGVQPSGSSADYHYRTEAAYYGIIEAARDLFRNHGLIGQGIRRLTANVVQCGFTLDTKTGDDELDAELVARWNEWAGEADACDIAGELSFSAYEAMVFQQTIVDGDCLTLPTRSGHLQLIEAHRVRTPRNTRRNVVHGVLLDQYRKRLEYWLAADDIDPSGSVAKVADMVRIPTRDRDGNRQVFHHYAPDRVSQTRGVTAFVPAVDTAGMGDDLMFAQLVKAQMAACVTIFRSMASDSQYLSSPQGQSTSDEVRPDGTTRTIAGFQPGMEVFGFPGEKLEGWSPNVPNAEFFQHASLILTIVSVNLDLPLAVLLLDPSKTNFSGWRGAIDQARMRFRVMQQWLIHSLHRPVYRWKVRQWAIDDPAIARAAKRSGVNLFGHKWHPPGWSYIEPASDSAADVVRERNLLISPRRRAMERGIDYDDLVREIVEDRSQMITAGHQAAETLNQTLGLQLTWRDVVMWPMPEGVQISVGPKPTTQSQQGESENDDAA